MSGPMYYQKGHVFRVFDLPRKAGGYNTNVLCKLGDEEGLPERPCFGEIESLLKNWGWFFHNHDDCH